MDSKTTNRLSGIFGEAARLVQAHAGRMTTLAVSQLRPGSRQPRKTFDQKALDALAQSIKAKGIQQPLLVRPVADGYEIVAGERRWRAAQIAGLLEVPVIEKNMTDQEAAEAALIENLQRKDLNAFEEIDGKLSLVALAWGITPGEARTRLNELLRHPQEADVQLLDALFSALGKESWQSYAKNKLRVYNWPSALVAALGEGMLMGTATLIAKADEQHQQHLIELWRSGASRAALAVEVQRLAPERGVVVEERLATLLKNRKWRAQLTLDEAEALQSWIQSMPESLRLKLEES